jgi:hypothetical protein
MNDQITSEKPKRRRVWGKVWQVKKNYLVAKTQNGDDVWVKGNYGFMPCAEPNDIISFYLEPMRPPDSPHPIFVCRYMGMSPKLIAKHWTEPLHAAEVVQEIAEKELKWSDVNERFFDHGKEVIQR